MTSVAAPSPSRSLRSISPGSWLPYLFGVAAFAVLFAEPFALLLRDWWNDPEAGHGLLLGPVAVWLAWKSRRGVALKPAHGWGVAILVGAVVLRYLSSLAAELFTMRMSMVFALAGLVVYFAGWARLRAWWLPFTLLVLSIPLPAVLVGTIALPLQFQASRIGAALLEMRGIPVRLDGNLILLPGHRLFVTEACSGLRSLTALLSLGVLAGGLWLRYPISRLGLVMSAIPVAVLLNGVRVFLTGFLVFFVDPKLGEGFMHMTEGWAMFVIAFAILGGFAWAIAWLENRYAARRAS